MKRWSIAIDGPAGAGKSSVAKILAGKLSYTYLDTGAMYRAVTYESIKRDITTPLEIADMAKSLSMEVTAETDGMHVLIEGTDITSHLRTPEVSAKVSEIASISAVREAMVSIQRNIANKGGIVLDGRDIGTVVLPNADFKVFLTASVHKRAERRFKEFKTIYSDITLEEVEKEIEKRDWKDSHREVSPLRPAEDAVIIDNSDLTLEETAELLLHMVKNN